MSRRKTYWSQIDIGNKKKLVESSVKVMVSNCESMHLYSIVTEVASSIVIVKANTPC